jgi:hypothetical protein
MIQPSNKVTPFIRLDHQAGAAAGTVPVQPAVAP